MARVSNGATPQRRESRTRRMIKRLRDRSAINPCYKYSLFFVNFIFLLVGIALTVASAYVLALKEKKITYFVEFLFDPPCLLCLAGCITFVVSFLGFVGALRENTLFLRIYYWTMSLLLLLQIVIIIFVFIFYFVEDASKKLNLYPEDLFKDVIKKYRDPYAEKEDLDLRNTVDDLQKFLQCCGVSNDDNGYKDWNGNPYFNCTSDSDDYSEKCSVPYSCCIVKPGENINYQCGKGALSAKDDVSLLAGRINTMGCLKAMKVVITDHAWTIGGIIIGILIPQAILICMSRTLYDQIQEQYSKW